MAPVSFRALSLALAAACVGAAGVAAYDRYSVAGDATNCRACHGDFRAASYNSLHDGQPWSSGLHDVHRSTMLANDCATCHSSGPFFPVLTRASEGGTGFEPIACAGCHGRAADENPPASGYAAGLRQHHYRSGVFICTDCHDDADPAAFTPAGEDVAPPYYFTPDPIHPGKPTDPCNPGGIGEHIDGGPEGLDNDGDQLYDAADCTRIFADGFETGDTGRWSSATP
jgi:hypothetical protein